MITHLAFYAGWPAAMSAAQLAYTVLVEDQKASEDDDGNDDIVVGFVGLGTMGGAWPPTCRRPATSSWCTTCTGRPPSHHLKPAPIWADTPRALAAQCDVIFTSLPEPPDVEAVALGADGLLAGMKQGAACFDLRPIRRAS